MGHTINLLREELPVKAPQVTFTTHEVALIVFTFFTLFGLIALLFSLR